LEALPFLHEEVRLKSAPFARALRSHRIPSFRSSSFGGLVFSVIMPAEASKCCLSRQVRAG
jgi:hypothetical protein